MTPQCKRLLNWLEKNGPITNLDAWQKLGIYRLGARIYDLRNEHGIKIADKTVAVRSRFGDVCHVKEFRLKGRKK